MHGRKHKEQRYFLSFSIFYKIFILLISIFGFLIFSLVLIIRLINTYHSVETQYVEKTIDIEYRERKRIAADLHDGLGSILSSIGLYINLLEKEVHENEKVKEKLIQLKHLFDMGLESVENAINNLNPTILNKYGLIKSLEIVCNKMNDIGNIFFYVESKNFNIKISKNTELNLYRISSELINNTLKHSGASEAKIEFNNKKKKVFLHYSDNGIGFDPSFDYSDEGEKTGLINIINRVETLEGTYSIISGYGNGVKITIQFNIG
ncbi:MAG: histidine kinase [Draconibacterium sp.]|nr:histidine kinase [Draconibacterium sp.]